MADRDPTVAEPCPWDLLAHGGPHLHRLIVVHRRLRPDPDMPDYPGTAWPIFDSLAARCAQSDATLRGWGAYNRGLEVCQGDVVLVSNDLASSMTAG